MQLKLNKLTAFLLLAALWPLVTAINIFRKISGGKQDKAVEYRNTFDGDPLDYTGDLPLVVALWTDWASVWKAATEPAIERLKQEYAGRCEFAYVECKDSEIKGRFQADILPMVIVYHRGAEVARFPNLLSEDQVKAVLETTMTPGNSEATFGPDDPHR